MNAVAYARYSTDKQTDNSIAYQLSQITEYCNKNKITLTGVYSDEACSGTNTNRTGFQEMISAAKQKNLKLLSYMTSQEVPVMLSIGLNLEKL